MHIDDKIKKYTNNNDKNKNGGRQSRFSNENDEENITNIKYNNNKNNNNYNGSDSTLNETLPQCQFLESSFLTRKLSPEELSYSFTSDNNYDKSMMSIMNSENDDDDDKGNDVSFDKVPSVLLNSHKSKKRPPPSLTTNEEELLLYEGKKIKKKKIVQQKQLIDNSNDDSDDNVNGGNGRIKQEKQQKQRLSSSNSCALISSNEFNNSQFHAGAVEAVEMINFLTHSNLSVTFDPRINFINGKNGSGKSAILAAIMVGLGGKARRTGRADKFNEFIQYGKSFCRVRIQLCNLGENAYRPEILGEHIVIERRIKESIDRNNNNNNIKKSGISSSSTFSIYGEKSGKFSDRRADLDAITDHFGLHVDNCLTWLTQDAAKEFLMSAKETELYLFFAKGAEIDDVNFLLSEIGAALTETSKRIQAKKDSLQSLLKKRADRSIILQTILKADRIKKRFDSLIAARGWCEYAEKLAQLNVIRIKLSKLNETAELNNKEILLRNDKILELNASRDQIQKQNFGSSSSGASPEEDLRILLNERKNSQAMSIALEAEQKTMIKEERGINFELCRIREELTRISEQLTDGERAHQNKYVEDANQIEKSLENDKKALKKTEENIQSINNDIFNAQENINQVQKELAMKKEILDAEKIALQKYIYVQENMLCTWGRRVPEILAAISRVSSQKRWVGMDPIGPLGNFVKPRFNAVTDGTRWHNLLRTLLGRVMIDFIVETHDDRDELQKIFNQFQHNANIIILKNAGQDLDLTGYLPINLPVGFTTALEQLEISHLSVKRALVINQRLEQCIFAPSRLEAEKYTENGYPRNVSGVYIDSGYSVGSSTGSRAMNNLRLWQGQACPFGFTGDVDNKLEKTLEFNIQRLQNEIFELEAKLNNLKSQKNRDFELKSQNDQQQIQIARQIAELNTSLEYLNKDIQEKNSVRPEISMFKVQEKKLDERLRAVERQKVELQSQLDELKKQKINQDNSIKIAKEACHKTAELREIAEQTLAKSELENRRITEQRKNLIQKEKQQKVEIENLQEEYDEKLNNLNALLLKLEEENKKTVESDNEEYDGDDDGECNEKKKSNNNSKRISLTPQEEVAGNNTKRLRESMMKISIEEFERRTDSLAAAERALRAQIAPEMTVARARNELDMAKKVFKDSQSEIEDLKKLRASLDSSLQKRIRKFSLITIRASTSASQSFRMRMAKRGYSGELVFNHANRTLHVSASVAGPIKGGSERSMQTYSGGEKSFTTVCLLLSLWDAIPSPIRCMDEFDVYMDGVNRAQSMRLLLEAAQSTAESQFLFITPLGLSDLRDTSAHVIDLDRIIRE